MRQNLYFFELGFPDNSKDSRIWLSLSCVAWFSGTVYSENRGTHDIPDPDSNLDKNWKQENFRKSHSLAISTLDITFILKVEISEIP